MRKIRNLLKTEQTYEEWLKATSKFSQLSNLSSSIEQLHNVLNEKKEMENLNLGVTLPAIESPLRIVGNYAEYAV